MKLLLDECVTSYLKPEFVGHEVSTIDEAGLKGLKNGNLLKAASDKFDVLIRCRSKSSVPTEFKDFSYLDHYLKDAPKYVSEAQTAGAKSFGYA